MVEVIVHDLMVRSPRSGECKWLAQGKDYLKLGLLRIILLKERQGERIFPIWVGPGEGDYIGMLLEKLSFVRPGPFELAASLIDAGAMKIEKVAVTALRENVYYASISVQAQGRSAEIDARPSDAISLALLTGAPILVAPEAFEQTAIENPGRAASVLEEWHRKGIADGKIQPETVDMEWRSFRSLEREQLPSVKEIAKE